MARTRQQDAGEDWSCPLCTLLNSAEDDRCAACDNARPPVHELPKSQLSEPSTAVATAPEVQHVYRPSTGVFFSSLPSNQRDLGTIGAWRQEPRLVVNRRRGIRRQNVSTDREEKECFDTVIMGENTDSTAIQRDHEQEIKAGTKVEGITETVEPNMTAEKEEEREEEEEDTAVDVEEPCFNLLGSGSSVFGVPEVQEAVEDQFATDEIKSQDGSEADDEVVVSPPPRYPGFIPASKVQIEEPKIEEKLASAGLDLSDSDDEDKEPKQFRRRMDEKDDSWEDKWVCQICTNLNDQTVMECSSCSYKRYRDNSHSTDTETGSSLRWACNVCTNLNPPDVTDCLMCLNKRNAATLNGVSNGRWKCSLCTTFNAPGTTRCEVCDRSREDEPNNATGKGRQCPVCTNINSPGSTRCELCDSSLHTDEEVPADQFVDLASSPPGGKSSYTVNERDLENPYADLSQYNEYDVPNEVADIDRDFVEEISDNERPTVTRTNTRPPQLRSELKEFEHFVCMEDLRSDYECRINYSKLFAGQRSRKSYADRLASRQAESRKRKRAAARKEAGGAASGGKTSKSGKKRKAGAGSRRASAGGEKAPRGKRAKKTGTPARRASSATTYSAGINHYDDSVADFGEDLNTMAWEGVGSAGYL